MAIRITEDENHQGTRRIFGVPDPYSGDEAVNKRYCDANAASGGGSSGIIDGGAPDTDYTNGPIIDCGEIT
jgi:hypothetical protein